jgi:protein O-GlcNAc transferase
LRLPRSYQPNALRAAGAPPRREAVGLPARGFVFAAFCETWKFSPDIVAVWLRLLRRVDGSLLWLLVEQPSAKRSLQTEAAQAGVDPARLVFAQRLAPAAHLARLRLVDLALDTYPYGAHTTASDALGVGAPMVSFAGRGFASRVASSLLRASSLDAFVGRDLAEYEEIAIAVARGEARFAEARRRLAAAPQLSPIFDGAAYAREFEVAIENVLATPAR